MDGRGSEGADVPASGISRQMREAAVGARPAGSFRVVTQPGRGFEVTALSAAPAASERMIRVFIADDQMLTSVQGASATLPGNGPATVTVVGEACGRCGAVAAAGSRTGRWTCCCWISACAGARRDRVALRALSARGVPAPRTLISHDLPTTSEVRGLDGIRAGAARLPCFKERGPTQQLGRGESTAVAQWRHGCFSPR